MDYKSIICDICILSAEEDADAVGENNYWAEYDNKLCRKSEIQKVYDELKNMKLREIILNYYNLLKQEFRFIGIDDNDNDVFGVDDNVDESVDDVDYNDYDYDENDDDDDDDDYIDYYNQPIFNNGKISKILSIIDDHRHLILDYLKYTPKKYCIPSHPIPTDGFPPHFVRMRFYHFLNYPFISISRVVNEYKISKQYHLSPSNPLLLSF